MTLTLIILLYLLIGLAIWGPTLAEVVEDERPSPLAEFITYVFICIIWPISLGRVCYFTIRDMMRDQR